jgi:hypothetical protein
MKRLLTAISLIAGVLLVLCTSAILIGGTQPTPNYLPELNRCEGAPCYMGIELDKTTSEEANQIFNSTPGFTLNPDSGSVYVTDGPVEGVVFYHGQDTPFIIDLEVSFRHGMNVPVYLLLTDLGVPCAIYTAFDPSRPRLAILSYPDMAVWVEINEQQGIRPESPVVAVELGGPYRSGRLRRDAHRCRTLRDKDEYVWQGFKKYP